MTYTPTDTDIRAAYLEHAQATGTPQQEATNSTSPDTLGGRARDLTDPGTSWTGSVR